MWAILIMIVFALLAVAPIYYTFGQTQNNTVLEQSQNEIDQSNRLVTEITRSEERYTSFMRQCTNLIKSNDLSQLATCDGVIQKYNFSVGKFLAENEAVIESIIYPYTLLPLTFRANYL